MKSFYPSFKVCQGRYFPSALVGQARIQRRHWIQSLVRKEEVCGFLSSEGEICIGQTLSQIRQPLQSLGTILVCPLFFPAKPARNPAGQKEHQERSWKTSPRITPIPVVIPRKTRKNLPILRRSGQRLIRLLKTIKQDIKRTAYWKGLFLKRPGIPVLGLNGLTRASKKLPRGQNQSHHLRPLKIPIPAARKKQPGTASPTNGQNHPRVSTAINRKATTSCLFFLCFSAKRYSDINRMARL